MKYQFMQAHQQEFCVTRMCHLLQVSRSGFYAWQLVMSFHFDPAISNTSPGREVPGPIMGVSLLQENLSRATTVVSPSIISQKYECFVSVSGSWNARAPRVRKSPFRAPRLWLSTTSA